MLAVAMLCSLSFTCIYVSAECQIAVAKQYTDHKIYFREKMRLRKTLFKDYDHKLSAVVESFNFTDKSRPRYEVLLTLTYIKLANVDESKQKAEFITEYAMNWRDERLEWYPKDYCGIDHIYVSNTDVWFPDITFVNAHSAADYRNDQHKFVRLNSSGHLYFNVDISTDTTCNTETQNFPFDRQKCFITIKSGLFFEYEYGIKTAFSPRLYSVVTFDDMGNEEWRVENLTAKYKEQESNDNIDILDVGEDMRMIRYSEYIVVRIKGEAGESHSHITVTMAKAHEQAVIASAEYNECQNYFIVWLKRCPSFYITMIIIPSFITNTLSIIGILKATDIMGKLGMALTSIMSLGLILGILATSLPRSERLPKIVIYVMANLLIVVFALTVAFALSCLKKIRSHSCEGNESDKRKLDENKRYRKAAYVLTAMFEIANLINLIVLIA